MEQKDFKIIFEKLIKNLPLEKEEIRKLFCMIPNKTLWKEKFVTRYLIQLFLNVKQNI